MATSSKKPRLTAMQKRLTLMQQALSSGRAPTTAQISAAYATMSCTPQAHTDADWAALLHLAQAAIGVTQTCLVCNGSGMVSQKADPSCPTCGAFHGCGCGENYVSRGFGRVTCGTYVEGMLVKETCKGSGLRKVHVPAPGELPGTISSQQAQLTLQQQVTAVLSQHSVH